MTLHIKNIHCCLDSMMSLASNTLFFWSTTLGHKQQFNLTHLIWHNIFGLECSQKEFSTSPIFVGFPNSACKRNYSYFRRLQTFWAHHVPSQNCCTQVFYNHTMKTNQRHKTIPILQVILCLCYILNIHVSTFKQILLKKMKQ